MKKIVSLAILFAVILASQVVFAEDRVGTYFNKLDTNSDGKISLEEFLNPPPKKVKTEDDFNRIDKNGDGFITSEEFANKMEKKGWKGDCDKAGKYFEKLDVNSDGQVSFEEFENSPLKKRNPEEVFKRLDENGDGYITSEEFANKKRQRIDKER